jgi:pimeloyl-ACP methyl ester carboxylesterase
MWLMVSFVDSQASQPRIRDLVQQTSYTQQHLVVIIPGLASSTTGWATVRRGLTSFVRVLQYQRSGYGESDPSPKVPTAVNIAQDLDSVLTKADLHPPFLLVVHSWGGIISREFFALRPEEVCRGSQSRTDLGCPRLA